MADKREYLDEKTQAVLDKYGVPNIAAVIVRDNGHTVVHSAKGVRDSSVGADDAANQVTKSDYFNVGSIAKPITGLLIACLIKQQVLRWTTTISDVFPEFTSSAFRERCGMNEHFLGTTVAQLMAHTSGINGRFFHTPNNSNDASDDTDPFRFIADQGIQSMSTSRNEEWQNLPAVTYQRYLYTVLSLKKEKYVFGRSRDLAYETVAQSAYGSTATMCAAMVERLMGQPFETVMTDLVSGPLPIDMIYGKLPDGMQYHSFDATQGTFVPQAVYNNAFAPYISKFVVGGIHMTVEGMAQYISCNLRAVDNSSRFDIDDYHAPVTDAAQGGLFLGGGANHEPLNHKGASAVSIALMHVFPHSGHGYAVMQNCNGGQSDAANAELFAELENMHQHWTTI